MQKCLALLLLCWFSPVIIGQTYYTNGIEFHASSGFSNISNEVNAFSTFSQSIFIIPEQIKPIWVKNYGISIFRYFNETSGIKLSFVIAENGLTVEGTSTFDQSFIVDTYSATTKELGASYLGRFPSFKNGFIIAESGIRFHMDRNFNATRLNLRQVDSYSFSGFLGYQYPLHSKNFFTTIGVLFKLSVKDYAATFSVNPPYFPYFIGLRVATNYQF